MTVLVKLPDRDSYWIEVWDLIRANHRVVLAEEHDFWANNAVYVSDFAPTFLVNEFHGRVLVGAVQQKVVRYLVIY